MTYASYFLICNPINLETLFDIKITSYESSSVMVHSSAMLGKTGSLAHHCLWSNGTRGNSHRNCVLLISLRYVFSCTFGRSRSPKRRSPYHQFLLLCIAWFRRAAETKQGFGKHSQGCIGDFLTVSFRFIR